MREPRLCNTESFPTSVSVEIDGRWVCARPLTMGRWCLLWRIKLAWRVFTGRYDALLWIGQET